MITKPFRAMWLLNHSSARKFEVPMLKQSGIDEIYLPKIVPDSPAYRSASIDYSEDPNLSIPKEDLDVLNQIDWYEGPTREAVEIANRYFQIAFFIATPEILRALTKYFKGAMILRAYGLGKDQSYHDVMNMVTGGESERMLRAVGRRFWFGQVFQNIDHVEPKYIKKQSVFLPLGTFSSIKEDEWHGGDRSIFFVCPDLQCNKYYMRVYQDFKRDFEGFPYKIAGTQSIMPNRDPNVLGFVSREQHERNMREMRVMFYHSKEPRHLHYHPIEAIQAGMPLVYMGGGVLDDMAGQVLPGRCDSVKEARNKISKILNDDWNFIKEIREAQPIILNSIHQERCAIAWKNSINKILAELQKDNEIRPVETRLKKKRVAVILPHLYRGGTLRAAKLVAEAVAFGARRSGEDVEVVFAHIDDDSVYSDADFSDISSSISKRPFRWEILDPESSKRAMVYAGRDEKNISPGTHYFVMNDGIGSFLDCDFWIFISDRVPGSVLPLCPYACIVYDYIQRYENVIPKNWDDIFINFARQAKCVMVTTKFTANDAVQYAGVPREKVRLIPNLLPFNKTDVRPSDSEKKAIKGYFLWVTNTAPHKNHKRAIAALINYYEVLSGKLECHVVGVNSNNLLTSDAPHLRGIRSMIDRSVIAKKKIKWFGELSDFAYEEKVSNAAFLWHPASVDNGTYAVIEAAELQVPSLSSDYPAMREIEDSCQLGMVWMDSGDVQDISRKMKWMENNADSLKINSKLPDQLRREFFLNSDKYWFEISNLLM